MIQKENDSFFRKVGEKEGDVSAPLDEKCLVGKPSNFVPFSR